RFRFFNTSARCWHLSIAFDESNFRICRRPSRGKFVAWSCVTARQLTCGAADGRHLSLERRTFQSWNEPAAVRDCHFPKSRIPARGIRQREQKWQLEHKFGGHLTTAWVGWAVRRDPPLRHENRDVDGEFQLRDFEAGGYFGFSPRLRSDVFDLP